MAGTVGKFRGVPGIASSLADPLEDAVRWVQGDNNRMLATAGIEVGGFFMSTPEEWTPERGWTASLRWVPIVNAALGPGTFEVTGQAVLDAGPAMRMDLRQVVALQACEKQGWDNGTASWTDVVAARIRNNAEIIELCESRGRNSEYDFDGERAMEEMVNEGIQEVREELVQCFPGGVHGENSSRGPDDSDDAPSVVGEGRGEVMALPYISAFNYLMMTGPAILAGMLHTHPRGSGEISPNDILGVKFFLEYQEAFAFASEQLEGYDGGMEKLMPGGHWMLGINSLGFVDSLTRYSSRGISAVIRAGGGDGSGPVDFRDLAD